MVYNHLKQFSPHHRINLKAIVEDNIAFATGEKIRVNKMTGKIMSAGKMPWMVDAWKECLEVLNRVIEEEKSSIFKPIINT